MKLNNLLDKAVYNNNGILKIKKNIYKLLDFEDYVIDNKLLKP